MELRMLYLVIGVSSLFLVNGILSVTTLSNARLETTTSRINPAINESPRRTTPRGIEVTHNEIGTTNSPIGTTLSGIDKITTTSTGPTMNADVVSAKSRYRADAKEECGALYHDSVSQKKATSGLMKQIKLWEAVVLIIGIGVIAALIGTGFHAIRKHVYHDAGSLDTAFDAGGSVSISLTASTVISHWTWGATLLVSCTVAAKFGISGPYFYAAGATVQIIIFAILSIQLKMKAPGAKTFLQVIYARFGKVAHLTFCVFALLTNVIITIALMVAGIAVIVGLVEELTPDLAAILLGIIIGSYTLIGGLGATFYVSYFNTSLIYALICWLVIEVFYNPDSNPNNPFGSSDNLFKLVDCWSTPIGNANYDQSFLTFFSSGGATFGIVNIVGNFGAVFCDQAYWQKSVAAKPLHGVWGFVLGAVTWFAVPFAMATTMGLAYIGLNSAHGRDLLSQTDIESGLVAPFVAQTLLGRNGSFIIMVLLLMATMAAGSSEVIAVAAIIVYDIYKIHTKPFKKDLPTGLCILCEKWENKQASGGTAGENELCQCPSMSLCAECKKDNERVLAASKELVKPVFECTVHGPYRTYLNALLQYKDWWIVIATFLSVILSIAAWYANLNLNWIYYFIGVLVSAAVLPIAYSVMWTKATAYGMVIGSISGLILAICSWLGYASTLPGGLSDFLTNTGNETSMLVGNLVAILGGGFICVVVSFASKPNWTSEELEAEWEKTRNIDNPLKPWVESYQDALELESVEQIHERPPLTIVQRKFRSAWYTALITTVILVGLLVIIWPLCVLYATPKDSLLDMAGFQIWTGFTQAWAYIAAVFIIAAPFIQETWSILRQVLANRRMARRRTSSISNGARSFPRLSIGMEWMNNTENNKHELTENRTNTEGTENGAFEERDIAEVPI